MAILWSFYSLCTLPIPRIWSNVWAPAQMLSLSSSSSRLRLREKQGKSRGKLMKVLIVSNCVVVFLKVYAIVYAYTQQVYTHVVYMYRIYVCTAHSITTWKTLWRALSKVPKILVTGKCATLEVSRRHFLRILTALLQVCVARLPNMLQ